MAIKYSLREPMAPGDTLLEKFRNLAELGFSGIEMTNSSTREYAEEIRKAVDETGITPNIFSSRGGMGLLDARKEERQEAIQSIKDALTLCGELGGVGVIFPPLIGIKMRDHAQRIPDLSPLYNTARLEKELLNAILKDEIAPHAEKCGCSIIIEPLNRYEQWWPCTVAHGVEICEAANSPGVTTMADLFHMSIEESDLAGAIHTGGKHIANVHLADSNRVLPGYGMTDFGPPLKALEEIGYPHYCGFECRIPSRDAKAELKKSMDYLNSQL
ncbi:MAG: sugar phosphate isomerase/epimerase [bacterium]|nr:sugar phosphate isomerase/epimerase [bacterium]